MPEPLFAAVEAADPPRPLFLLGPGGRRFDQALRARARRRATASRCCAVATRASTSGSRDHLVRRRAVDRRLRARRRRGRRRCVVIEAVARLLPGVMGNDASAADESFGPTACSSTRSTRGPAEFRGWAVPEVLRSGDHARIARWRRAQALHRTLDAGPTWSSPGRARPTDEPPCWKTYPASRLSFVVRSSNDAREEPRAMNPTDLVDHAEPARRHPRLRPRRHPEGARPGGRRQHGARPGLPGRRHRPPGLRPPGDLHGPQGQLRRRRRAHLPGAFADRRQDRGRHPGRRPPGQALLPARPHREGRQDQEKRRAAEVLVSGADR